MIPATYTKQTKHRKRCFVCNKLIQDGEQVLMEQWKKEGYYPVKGIMRFTRWKFMHAACEEELERQREAL